jgi:hypothetical protein
MTPDEKLVIRIEITKIEINERHEYDYELGGYYKKGRPLDDDDIKGRTYILQSLEEEYNKRNPLPF